MNINKLIKNPLYIILLVGLMHLGLMWPGMLNPDSSGQYQMAIDGMYNDHHPPLMSLVWRYLNYIIPHYGVMFLLHLGLMYTAIFYLIVSLKNFKYKFLLILFPLIPQIWFYENVICKDVGFAFSFLLTAAYLSYLTSNKITLKFHQIVMLLTILLYGTSVKFQAQYLAFILLGWMAYIIANYEFYNKKFLKIFSILLLFFYIVLHSVNFIFIPNVHKNHSWQYVKMFDLAAINVATNQDLFPDFIKNKNFTRQKFINDFYYCESLIKCKYGQYQVDSLIFGNTPILKTGTNYTEGRQLYVIWAKSVLQHPLIYLRHRCINIIGVLFGMPATFKFDNKIITMIMRLTVSDLIPTIISVIYFAFGILVLRKMGNINWYAIPLVCFNAIGILMIWVLFFCSMASTPRYTYISMCMVHASHVFAYLCFKTYRYDQKHITSAN